MNGLEPLIPITLILAVAGTVILKGPLGKALADRIAGRVSPGPAGADREALEGVIDELHHRLADVEERLDFTERVLAQRRAAEHLGSVREGSDA